MFMLPSEGTGERGGVLAFRDTNGDGRFDVKEHFGSANLTGIVLHNGYLYVASRTSVERYKMTPRTTAAFGRSESIVIIAPETRHPDKGLASTEKAPCISTSGHLPTHARKTTVRNSNLNRIPARFSKISVAFGSSIRTG